MDEFSNSQSAVTFGLAVLLSSTRSKHVPVYCESRIIIMIIRMITRTLPYSVNNQCYIFIYDHSWRGIFRTKVF